MNKIQEFQKLALIFISRGFNLFLVGGTVRDYLLNKDLTDMDAVSDATPFEILSFLPNIDTTFAHLGSLKYKNENGLKFDITTLREESDYFDSRHPKHINFVKDLKLDYLRRDFTINAMYMDKDLNIIDYSGGRQDLTKHILRMIGDPDTRLKEDPLRILRAIRFALMFNLVIEPSLYEAMQDRFYLLSNITDAKIRSEIDKIKEEDINLKYKKELLSEFDIVNLKGVIK